MANYDFKPSRNPLKYAHKISSGFQSFRISQAINTSTKELHIPINYTIAPVQKLLDVEM